MKRSLSLILVFAMVLSMLPGTALATGNSGTNSLYSNDNDTEIVVSNQNNIYSNGDDTGIVGSNQNDIYSNGDDTEIVGGNPMPVTSIAPQQNGTGTESDPYLVDSSSELVEAIANPDIGYIKLNADITGHDADATITIASGRVINFDLGGHVLAGTSDQTDSNRNMFDVRGTLTVTNGTITIQHTGTDMGWGNSTNAFNVTAGGVLNITNATVKNLGGSAMNFAIHLNNWGEVTLNISNSVIEAVYIPVRVFNSGPDINNVSFKSSTLESTGGNRVLWVHNFTSADFGGKTYSKSSTPYSAEVVEARLNFDIFDGSNTFTVANTAAGRLIELGYTNAVNLDASGNYIVRSSAALLYVINQATAGEVIKLGSNIELTEGLVIPAGKTVTLDLNGYILSGTSEATASSAVIENNGSLTIQDSATGGKITAFANNPDTTSVPAYANNTITNRGTLTLLSGTIENSTSDAARACFPIDNNSTTSNSVVTISGGTVTGRGAVRQFANSSTYENTVNINGGQVLGSSYAVWVQNPGSGDPNAELNITAGSVDKVLMSPSANFGISISGGNIKEVAIWEPDGNNSTRNPYGFITGGSFSNDPSAYLPEGYAATENNGFWTVANIVPDMTGTVVNVNRSNAQLTLDGAFGDITGKTINFTENITAELVLARPTKYAGSSTEYVCGTGNNHSGESKVFTDAAEFLAHYDGAWHTTPYYYRALKDVTFTADEGVTVAGFTYSAGHVYANGNFDYVRDLGVVEGQIGYYSNASLEGITFQDLTFTGRFDAKLYQDGASVEGITFDGCTFLGTTDDNANAAIKFLADSQYFTNITVKNCTISNYNQGVYIAGIDGASITGNKISDTSHNSIALQSCDSKNPAKGTISVAENYLANSGDRAIRMNYVDATANIAINNNVMVNCGDDEGQLIKATAVADGADIDLENNYWDGKELSTAINNLSLPTAVGIISGSWAVDVSDYCANDYTATEKNGVWTVAPTQYVAKNGSTLYTSVTAAINDANDGDIIDVLPGTFDEYIAPWSGDSTHASEKSITLKGAAARNEGETVLTGGMYLGYDDSQNRGHNITVEGFTFQGKGILVAGQDIVTIRNNKFENITDLVATSGSAAENAISVIGKDVTAIIENNVISTVTAAGINLRNTKSVAVSGNTITAAGETSVLVQNNSAEGAITITGNTMSGWGTSANQGRAVRTVGGSAVTVTGNKMINAAAPEEFVKCTGLGEGVEVNLTKNYWNGQDPATQAIVTVDGTVNVTMAPYFVADTMRDPQDLNDYVEPTYTVTMVGKMAEDSGNGSYPAGTTVTINAGSPATGYVFDKWTSEDGVVFADATSSTTTFVMPAKNVTVTATWKALPRFSVTFKDGDSVIDTKDYLEGETIVAPSAPTKTGYTFEGWIGYTEGMTVGTAHLTFVAQWSESSSGGTDSPADPGPSAPVDPAPSGPSSPGAPSTPTTPTAPVTPPAVEVPEVNDTTIDTSAPTISTETKEDEDGSTTTTETKEDGTVVETTQKTDGSTTTTATKSETTENEDGSKTTTSTTNTTTTDSSGATVTEQKQESKTEAADGSVTTTVTENITTTDSSGATVTEQKQESKIEAADGSVTTTTINNTTKTDAEGNTAIESKVEEKVETENTTTTTTTTTTQDAKGNTEKTEAKEETVVNEDGTTTTTTSSTTETALANGSTGTTVVDTTGQVTADVTISEQAVAEAAKAGETVALPMPAVGSTASTETAPVINVTNPSTETVTVEIPVAQAGAGTVVVIVHEDGSEEIVPKTAQTENGLSVKLAGNATVKVVDNAKSFGDTENHWAGNAIDHASSRELFDGVGDNSFAPDETMNRAMLATVLWRLEGKQEATTQSTFDDLESGHWSEEAVLWASENDIIKGSNGSFDGEGEVTREQMVTMLYRMSGSPAVEAEDTVDGASDWAADAVAWAVKIGLMKGDGTGLNLQGSATRAQIATFLMRFVNMMY